MYKRGCAVALVGLVTISGIFLFIYYLEITKAHFLYITSMYSPTCILSYDKVLGCSVMSFLRYMYLYIDYYSLFECLVIESFTGMGFPREGMKSHGP